MQRSLLITLFVLFLTASCVEPITTTADTIYNTPTITVNTNVFANENSRVSLSVVVEQPHNDVNYVYTWQQTKGDTINLQDASSAVAYFDAGDIETLKEYSFSVSVTTNTGNFASTQVNVFVSQTNATLLGPIGNASISVYSLSRIINNSLTETTTATITATSTQTIKEAAKIGSVVTTPFSSTLTEAGLFQLSLEAVADDEWLLLVLTSGNLLDRNVDGQQDLSTSLNTAASGIRAIGRAADWKNGAFINAFTELSAHTLLGADTFNVLKNIGNVVNIENSLNDSAVALFKNSIYDNPSSSLTDLITYEDILHFSPYKQGHLSALKVDYRRQIVPVIDKLLIGNKYLDITPSLYISNIVSNSIPQINLPDTISVVTNRDYTLTATIVDEDNIGDLVFKWDEIDNASISLTSASATVVLDYGVSLIGQTITLQLEVYDSLLAVASKTLSVVVKLPNVLPTIDSISIAAGSDNIIKEGETFSIASRAMDSDGHILSYQWQQLSGTSLVLANSTSNTITATSVDINSANSEVLLNLTVTDNELETYETKVRFTIYDETIAPTVIVQDFFELYDNSLSEISASYTIENDGSSIEGISWYVNSPYITFTNANNIKTSVSTFDVVKAGATVTANITIIDDSNESVAETFTIYIKNRNREPSLMVSNDLLADENTTITLTAIATDPDIDSEYNYSWFQVAQEGIPAVTINEISETQVQFIAPDIEPNLNIMFVRVLFNDGDGGVVSDTIKITLNDIEPQPEISIQQQSFTLTFNITNSFNLTVTTNNTAETGFTSSIVTQGLYGTASISGAIVTYTLTDETVFVSGDNIAVRAELADGSAISNATQIGIRFYDTRTPTFSISPANSSTTVATASTITITSDIPLDITTINNTKDTACNGTIIISIDNFSNCLAFERVFSDLNRRITINLAEPLVPNTEYKIRISPMVESIFNAASTVVDFAFTTAKGDILINEISSSASEDAVRWIELYNPSVEVAFLNEYQLHSRHINSSNSKLNERIFTLPKYQLNPGEYVILHTQNHTDNTGDHYSSRNNILIIGDNNDRFYWGTEGFLELRSVATPAYTEDYVVFGLFLRDNQLATNNAWSGSPIGYVSETPGYSLSRRHQIDTNRASDWVQTPYPTFGSVNDTLGCTVDADEDNIPDCAEVAGSTYAGINMYELGARQNRKDLFIEVDIVDSTMDNTLVLNEGVYIRQEALQRVKNIFEQNNIYIYFDVGDIFHNSPGIDANTFDLGGGGVIEFKDKIGFNLAYPSMFVGNSFYDLKLGNMHISRYGLFRYLIMADVLQIGTDFNDVGLSEVLGDDMIVALGYKALNSTTLQNEIVLINIQAAVIMHQIGHILGLRHGGDVNEDYKVNYLSIMNNLYLQYGLPDPNSVGDRYYQSEFNSDDSCYPASLSNSITTTSAFSINFSNGTSGAINENNISEYNGVGRANYVTIDFNCDGDTVDSGITRNLNSKYDSILTEHSDYNDWDNLNLKIRHLPHSNIFGPSYNEQ